MRRGEHKRSSGFLPLGAESDCGRLKQKNKQRAVGSRWNPDASGLWPLKQESGSWPLKLLKKVPLRTKSGWRPLNQIGRMEEKEDADTKGEERKKKG